MKKYLLIFSLIYTITQVYSQTDIDDYKDTPSQNYNPNNVVPFKGKGILLETKKTHQRVNYLRLKS